MAPINSTIDSLVVVVQAIAGSASLELSEKFLGISAIMREAKALGWSEDQERKLTAEFNRCAVEFQRREGASFIPYEQSQMDHLPANPANASSLSVTAGESRRDGETLLTALVDVLARAQFHLQRFNVIHGDRGSGPALDAVSRMLAPLQVVAKALDVRQQPVSSPIAQLRDVEQQLLNMFARTLLGLATTALDAGDRRTFAAVGRARDRVGQALEALRPALSEGERKTSREPSNGDQASQGWAADQHSPGGL